MAKARLSMRKIKEVLRVKFNCALSRHQIAESCQISRSTAADYLDRFEKAGLSWPLPEELSDEELEKKLFPPGTSVRSAKPLPDFDYIYRELNLLSHRHKSKPRAHGRPKDLLAKNPNEVWSWDITYMNSAVRGAYYYLYLVEDIFSRMIVGWTVALYRTLASQAGAT